MIKYFHALFFISAIAACSDESSNGGNAGDPSDAGATTGGSGGGSAGASSGAGGGAMNGSGGGQGGTAGSGGSSGGAAGSDTTDGAVNTGGSGGAMRAGMHCSPGTFYDHPVDTYGLGNMENCRGDQVFDAGIPVSDFFNIRSIELPSPTQPGQPYAFSIVINTPGIEAELWGSDEQCGFGFEKFWEGNLVDDITCISFVPQQAHSHLLMVWRSGGEHEDVTLCPMGSCGN